MGSENATGEPRVQLIGAVSGKLYGLALDHLEQPVSTHPATDLNDVLIAINDTQVQCWQCN